jgi:hypothetical protein
VIGIPFNFYPAELNYKDEPQPDTRENTLNRKNLEVGDFFYETASNILCGQPMHIHIISIGFSFKFEYIVSSSNTYSQKSRVLGLISLVFLVSSMFLVSMTLLVYVTFMMIVYVNLCLFS